MRISFLRPFTAAVSFSFHRQGIASYPRSVPENQYLFAALVCVAILRILCILQLQLTRNLAAA